MADGEGVGVHNYDTVRHSRLDRESRQISGKAAAVFHQHSLGGTAKNGKAKAFKNSCVFRLGKDLYVSMTLLGCNRNKSGDKRNGKTSGAGFL